MAAPLFTKDQLALIKESEDIMNSYMAGTEEHVQQVEEVYQETLDIVLAKLASIYNKYKTSPTDVKNYQIAYMVKLEKLVHKLQERLYQLGSEYTDSLEGVLTNNYTEVVKQKADKNQINLTYLKMMAISVAMLRGYKKFNFKVDWQGKTLSFSQRVSELINKGISEGKSLEELSKDLQKEMSKFIYHAKRIALTESARVINQAQVDTYKAQGIKYIKWSNAPEEMVLGRTIVVCPQCREIARLNDGIYPIDNIPPYPAHPHCRCTLAPYTK